jgi:tetratricopeptide (TPR) repeat protein
MPTHLGLSLPHTSSRYQSSSSFEAGVSLSGFRQGSRIIRLFRSSLATPLAPEPSRRLDSPRHGVSLIRLPPDQMLARAESAYRSMQLPFAENACRSVLAVQPQNGVAWLLLARILMEASRLEEVEELLRRAERWQAPGVEVMQSRSSLYWREGRDEECMRVCREILAIRPGDEEATCRMASCERRMGHPADALSRVSRFKTNPVGAAVSGWSHIDLKQFDEAIAVAGKGLEFPTINATQRANLWHIIGLANESLERFDAAIEGYTKAKEEFKGRLDETAMRKNFAHILEVFSKEFMSKAPVASERTERPVFIASMPRSGTTLLDRIIASHPQGAGAGETRALRGQINDWGTPDGTVQWVDKVPTLTVDDFNRIAARYLKETDQFGKDALRMADKHLMNWLSVGLIALAFPAARVIHLRRDPIDVGISCFERLRPVSVPWSSSLRSIGIAMKACDVMMDHWKSVTKIPILTVQYETLVRDTESETRRIIEFLGLPWDDACLAHHRKATKGTGRTAEGATLPPPTLSSEQASKPITDASIGRGARFGAALDAMRAAYAEPIL